MTNHLHRGMTEDLLEGYLTAAIHLAAVYSGSNIVDTHSVW